MARKSSNEYPEMPMDIVAGNIAHLMQRKPYSDEQELIPIVRNCKDSDYSKGAQHE